METNAPAALARLIPQLTKLTAGQPTTAEIEEAHKTSRAITRLLVEWLADRYCSMASGNDALRAVAVERYTEVDFGTLNPAEEAAFDQIEAQAQKDAEARQAVEAERINAAHPEVFNISDFAAKSLGMSRGA